MNGYGKRRPGGKEVLLQLHRKRLILGNVWICSCNAPQYYSLPFLLFKNASRFFLGIFRKSLRFISARNKNNPRQLEVIGSHHSSDVLPSDIQGNNGTSKVVSPKTNRGERKARSGGNKSQGNRKTTSNKITPIKINMPFTHLAPNRGTVITYNFQQSTPTGPARHYPSIPGPWGGPRMQRKITIRVFSESPIFSYWTDDGGLADYQAGRSFHAYNVVEQTTRFEEILNIPHDNNWFLIMFNPNPQETHVFYEVLV